MTVSITSLTPYEGKNNMKAIWNNTIIAESDDTVTVEGNLYFPMESLKKEYIEESETTSFCSWKGTANYLSLIVNNEKNTNAIWFYKTPNSAAKEVTNRVAFWNGVQITD